ncbi:MAG: hypothetical protein H7A36_07260 [Chlamydiales bacterium]|nr:hypothetical protein [Chlamydiales bacterium]
MIALAILGIGGIVSGCLGSLGASSEVLQALGQKGCIAVTAISSGIVLAVALAFLKARYTPKASEEKASSAIYAAAPSSSTAAPANAAAASAAAEAAISSASAGAPAEAAASSSSANPTRRADLEDRAKYPEQRDVWDQLKPGEYACFEAPSSGGGFLSMMSRIFTTSPQRLIIFKTFSGLEFSFPIKTAEEIERAPDGDYFLQFDFYNKYFRHVVKEQGKVSPSKPFEDAFV